MQRGKANGVKKKATCAVKKAADAGQNATDSEEDRPEKKKGKNSAAAFSKAAAGSGTPVAGKNLKKTKVKEVKDDAVDGEKGKGKKVAVKGAVTAAANSSDEVS